MHGLFNTTPPAEARGSARAHGMEASVSSRLEVMNPTSVLERLAGSRQQRDPSSTWFGLSCAQNTLSGKPCGAHPLVHVSAPPSWLFPIKVEQASAGMQTGFLLEALGFTEASAPQSLGGGGGVARTSQRVSGTISTADS